MLNVPEDQILIIGNVLNNDSRPLKERFRALFTLRNIGGPIALQCINECFKDSSALLKHELAYCLGQMQDEKAIPMLIQVLENKVHEPIVRHEAAEALGAIGSPATIPVLEKYKSDSIQEIAETCQLAIERIQVTGDKSVSQKSPYCSVDPTPPSSVNNLDELKRILLDEKASLFERYKAMFALRNLQTSDAVLALCLGLKAGSALFRHEVAFVLGQMQHEASVPFLKESLEDCQENEMVRHECAEALGSIATEDCMEIINKYLTDDKRVVRESCEIALDMCEYENSPEFQYANALSKIA